MYCNQCGAELRAEAQFCSKCGGTVAETPVVPQGIAPSASINETTSLPNKNSPLKVWLLVGIILLVIGGGGVMGWQILVKKDSKNILTKTENTFVAETEAGQENCMSNIKQLTTALQIYVQENQGKYPPAAWATAATGIDATSPKVFICPEDNAVAITDENSQISYGYNGLLIKADGKGVSEAMITSPTMVGSFADATPEKTVGNPGLIGGSAGRTDNVVDIAYRHDGGAIVGFVDGHVKLITGAPDARDINSTINQAFTMAPGLGYLTYQGSGITKSVTFDAPAPTMQTILVGDYCTMPIMDSAASIINTRARDKGMVLVRNFTGQCIPGGRNGFSRDSTVENPDFIVGIGDGSIPVANAVALGKDVVVAIKAKSSNIPTLESVSSLASYYTKGNALNNGSVYSFDMRSGTRAFIYSKFGLTTDNDDSKCTIAMNDYDMVQKIANDPNGIGYCSAAFVDPNLVEIITIGGVGLLDQVNTKNSDSKYLWPIVAPSGNYPFTRTLYAQCALNPTVNGAATVFQYLSVPATTPGSLLGAIQSGPLFKLSYFVK